jgi:hypothetical protein
VPHDCRYYHRSIQPKKLIETRFSALSARMTMTRTIRLYALPDVSARVYGAPFKLRSTREQPGSRMTSTPNFHHLSPEPARVKRRGP